MAAEPVWQPNYVDLCDERSIRFGAQCVICDARYATPGESLDKLLVREAIPDGELPQEIENAKHYVFTEFGNAYNGMLVMCYRCQRPACPDCWDDDNKMCGECVAARGLVRSPRRGLPSSNPLSDGRLVRVEPGRHSDAQRPTWLNALIATQSLDEPLGTPPKQQAVRPRPADEPLKRTLLDAALLGTSSPGAQRPDISSPGMPPFGASSPGTSSPGMPAFGTSSPGISSPPGMPSFGMSSPGMSSPGAQSFGASSPGASLPDMPSFGMSSPGMSSPAAIHHAAQASYPGGAFAPEPSYGYTPPASPFAPQAGAFPAAPAGQFSAFPPPMAPLQPQMADEDYSYAAPTDAAYSHAAPNNAAYSYAAPNDADYSYAAPNDADYSYAASSAPALAERGAAGASPGSGGGSAMVLCPRCGTSNYDFVTRCTNCQLRLIQTCPHCQQLTPAHLAQCEFCGEPLNYAPGASQASIPVLSNASGRTRGRGKNAADAARRQPKARREERQSGRSATGEMQTSSQKAQGAFVMQSGILVDYMEAHPLVAMLTLWGERLLTAIVVIFVAGLVTSVATAELSPSANETLRSVFHIDIRQILAHFVTQMQLLLERFKH